MWREFISVHSLPADYSNPFLAETGKSSTQARGKTGVRLEALNNQLLKSSLNVCDGATVSGITGKRQQVCIRSALFFPCSEQGAKCSQAGSCFPVTVLTWIWSSSPLRVPMSSLSALTSLSTLSSAFLPACWIAPTSCPVVTSNKLSIIS